LDTLGAVRFALSHVFPPAETPKLRRSAAQSVKSVEGRFGTVPTKPIWNRRKPRNLKRLNQDRPFRWGENKANPGTRRRSSVERSGQPPTGSSENETALAGHFRSLPKLASRGYDIFPLDRDRAALGSASLTR